MQNVVGLFCIQQGPYYHCVASVPSYLYGFFQKNAHPTLCYSVVRGLSYLYDLFEQGFKNGILYFRQYLVFFGYYLWTSNNLQNVVPIISHKSVYIYEDFGNGIAVASNK